MAQTDKLKFGREQQVQDWLESAIAKDLLSDVIVGANKVRESLAWSESPEFKPPFPIDYLTRLGNLRSAEHVLGELHNLELISKTIAASLVKKAKASSSTYFTAHEKPPASFFLK